MPNPVIAAGTTAFAAAEMAGDKMKTAWTRSVPVGFRAECYCRYAGALPWLRATIGWSVPE